MPKYTLFSSGEPSFSSTKFKSSFWGIECIQRIFRLGCSESRSFPRAQDIFTILSRILKTEISRIPSKKLKPQTFTDDLIMI